MDASGHLYVGEQRSHRVRRIDARTGVISTVVGNGTPGSSGDGGVATRAQTNYPKVALDRDGNIYVGEVDGYRIRRIDARSGVIATVAGTGVPGFSGDGGAATAAQLTRPFGLVVDGDGHLYFTDTEVNRVRRIDARTGIITTVAGTGRYEFSGDGGPATAASLARPHVLAIDKDGNLVIGDSFNQRIRRVDRATGIIETIAGAGYRGTSGDNGPATAATFVYFGGLAYDTAGNLLVSGVGDHRVRRIDARTGVIEPFAGTGRWESSGDGGQALDASFHPALEMAVNARNDVFVVDAYGGRVRKIDGRTRIVTTVAGSRAPSPHPGDFHAHFDEAALARALDTPVMLDLPGASDARVREALDYTGTGDPRRRMEIYTPSSPRRTPLGVVVLVHGSAGTDLVRPPTQWNAWTSRGRMLAAAGFAAVAFSHSLNQERGLERAAGDLTMALAYLRSHAPALGIDADRICVVGYADGAPLLAELVRRPVPGVRCLAAFSPVVNLGSSPPPFWIEGDTAVRTRFSLTSALSAGATFPPTMLLVGARAPESSLAVARSFADAARARGVAVTVAEHPTGGPDFDRGTRGPDTERLLREFLSFLREHLQ
jgi:acetyl esterase/lipase/sugar lactone lactonase YvrE